MQLMTLIFSFLDAPFGLLMPWHFLGIYPHFPKVKDILSNMPLWTETSRIFLSALKCDFLYGICRAILTRLKFRYAQQPGRFTTRWSENVSMIEKRAF